MKRIRLGNVALYHVGGLMFYLLKPGRLVTLVLVFLVVVPWLLADAGLLIAGIDAWLVELAVAITAFALFAGVHIAVWVSFGVKLAGWPWPFGTWSPTAVTVCAMMPLLVLAWWALAIGTVEPGAGTSTGGAWRWMAAAWLLIGIPLAGLLACLAEPDHADRPGARWRGPWPGLAAVFAVSTVIVLSAAIAGRYGASAPLDPLVDLAILTLVVGGAYLFGFQVLGFAYLAIICWIVPPSD